MDVMNVEENEDESRSVFLKLFRVFGWQKSEGKRAFGWQENVIVLGFFHFQCKSSLT